MSSARLGLAFVRRSGPFRFAMQAASVAMVAGLALVALAVSRFPGGGLSATSSGSAVDPSPVVVQVDLVGVSNLLSDGGVRPGYVFALLLICLVPLTLFIQVVRLGAAARGRRFDQLHLAGASRRQLRAIAVVEVAAPTLFGTLLGWPAFLWLREVFGPNGISQWSSDPDVRRELLLVAPGASAPWWQVALALAAVLLLGCVAGAGVDRGSIGAARRPEAAPVPWPALVLVCIGGVLIALVYVNQSAHTVADAAAFVGIVAALAGLLVGARWVAWAAARFVSSRAQSPGLLLAASRLVSDSGRAGRAGATVGAIALVAGGGASLAADLISGGNGEALYVVPTISVFVVIALALVVMMFALSVHAIESVAERRRSMAALVAGGVPLEVLDRALRWETVLIAVPVSALGLALGAVAPAPFLGTTFAGMGVRVLVVVCFLAVVGLGTLISSWMVRPWLVRAADPVNLRAS